jgi:hypothetical protein
MAMATVIWATAAEVIIMDGAEDAVIIITIADTSRRRTLSVISCAFSAADDRFVPVKVSRCLGS